MKYSNDEGKINHPSQSNHENDDTVRAEISEY